MELNENIYYHRVEFCIWEGLGKEWNTHEFLEHKDILKGNWKIQTFFAAVYDVTWKHQRAVSQGSGEGKV
jgi:hypothetical protein